MNSLERELAANLERTREREERRFRRMMIGGGALGVAGVFALFAARPDTTLVDALCMTLIALAFVAARYLPRALKQLDGHHVAAVTTKPQRELSYRESVATRSEEHAYVPPRAPSILWFLALVPIGIGLFAFAAGADHGRVEGAGMTLTGIGLILSGQRIYGKWRARRNVRLELEWERWLESADSCKIGARKWTK